MGNSWHISTLGRSESVALRPEIVYPQMLSEIRITQFRSCAGLVFENPGSLTALVGRNGTGKTAILKAIELLAQFISDEVVALSRDPVQLGLVASVDGTVYDYSLRTTLRPPHRSVVVEEELRIRIGEADFVLSRKGETVEFKGTEVAVFQIKDTTPVLPVMIKLFPPQHEIPRLLGPLMRFMQSVHYYPLDEASTTDESSYIPEYQYTAWRDYLADSHNPRSVANSPVYRMVHLAITDSEKFSELKSLLGPNGLGLVHDIVYTKIPVVTKPTEPDPRIHWLGFFVQQPYEKADPRILNFDQLSLGTRRVIQLLLAIVCTDDTVLLIEHPEDGIHRGLLRKVVDIVRVYSKKKQVILTTHSPVVFDMLEPSDIRLTSIDSQGHTSLRKLTSVECSAATKYLDEHGSLSDFLQAVED
jgi:predicted ATPase